MIVLFIIAQFFALLALLLTIFGSAKMHNIVFDINILLSIAVSIMFIVLITIISIHHPWVYIFYGISCAGSMLFMMQHDKSNIGYSIFFAVICLLFWAQMLALMIFNLMFVAPREIDDD